jgi:hypothetical protein
MARATIAAILAAGFSVTVNNGEEDDEISSSRDAESIYRAMFSTDEDYLHVVRHKPGAGANVMESGWIRFIYGNEGPDVINDYTTNLESILEPIVGIHDSSLSSRLERGEFTIVVNESPAVPAKA